MKKVISSIKIEPTVPNNRVRQLNDKHQNRIKQDNGLDVNLLVLVEVDYVIEGGNDFEVSMENYSHFNFIVYTVADLVFGVITEERVIG